MSARSADCVARRRDGHIYAGHACHAKRQRHEAAKALALSVRGHARQETIMAVNSDFKMMISGAYRAGLRAPVRVCIGGDSTQAHWISYENSSPYLTPLRYSDPPAIASPILQEWARGLVYVIAST